MATTDSLGSVSGRDIRSVALSIGDKSIFEVSVQDDLALLVEYCPRASIALLSNRDDEATALAALSRGIRGFLPTSLSVQVAVAGLRLVLAGGAYRPLPIIRLDGPAAFDSRCPRGLAPVHLANGAEKGAPDKTLIDFTPREQQVFAELELGLPNKLIAAKLNLSEHTVKMHIQHIMRKCAARNRTEAVLRCNGRLSPHIRETDTSASSSSDS